MRDAEPVLIWPALVATAMSAMVTSSVSPLRWLMIVVKLLRRASSMASSVSVRVPIWFTLIRMLLPAARAMPSARRFVFVTNRSSPTSCTLPPSSFVSFCQPSQSSSARPSSIERIGHFAHSFFHRSIISSLEAMRSGLLLKKQ